MTKKRADVELCAWTRKSFPKNCTEKGFCKPMCGKMPPGTLYPEHTHTQETAHIILSGEMTLTMNGRTMTYRAGGRCDVRAGTVHSAKMGPQGCRYLIGER
jgi:hypothetical protein